MAEARSTFTYMGMKVRLELNTNYVAWTPIAAPAEGCLPCCGGRKDYSARIALEEVIGAQLVVRPAAFPSSCCEYHKFEILTLHRPRNDPCQWRARRHVFSANNVEDAQRWVEAIHKVLALDTSRPRSINVFINPFSGKRSARAVWRSVEGLFSAAGINVRATITEGGGHAMNAIAGLHPEDLDNLHGLVAVGGDGLFQELVMGLMQLRKRQPTCQELLHNLRLGHIPAGSTDALAYSLHGTRDAISAALHIVLGDRCRLDVGQSEIISSPQPIIQPPAPTLQPAIKRSGSSAQADASAPLCTGEGSEADEASSHCGRVRSCAPPSPQPPQRHFFTCQAAFGFLGDVLRVSESMRWMGPSRYDVSGALAYLNLQTYHVKVSYQRAPYDSQFGVIKCMSGCRVCEDSSTKPLTHHHSSPELRTPQPGGCTSSASSSRSLSTATVAGSPPAQQLPLSVTAAVTTGQASVPAKETLFRPLRPACMEYQLMTCWGSGPEEEGKLPLSTPADASTSGDEWNEVEGHFTSIMVVASTCRSSRSPVGLLPHAHLSDGRLYLVLVGKCSRVQYLAFLLQLSSKGVTHDMLPFVKMVPITAATVQPLDGRGTWGIDGEILPKGAGLRLTVQRGAVSVFARGVESVS